MLRALRSLRRMPGWAISATALLVCALSLSTLTFAMLDGALLRPLPYAQADNLFQVESRIQSQSLTLAAREVRATAQVFGEQNIAAFRYSGTRRLAGIGSVTVAETTSSFLQTLGVGLAYGSLEMFSQPGQPTPAFVTQEVWSRAQRQMDNPTPFVLRSEDGATGAVMVIGVLPASFVFPDSSGHVDLLTPLVIAPGFESARGLRSILRKPSGVPLSEVEARLSASWKAFPNSPTPRLTDLRRSLTRRFRPFLQAAGVAAGLLLFLGVGNLVVLFRVRIRARGEEIATMRALGASAWHVARLIGSETLVLVVMTGLVSLLLTAYALPLLESLMPSEGRVLQDGGLTLRTVVFLIAIQLTVLGLLCVSQFLAASHLRARNVSLGRVTASRNLLEQVQSSIQAALAFVLVLGGLLVIGSLGRVFGEELGIASQGLAVFVVDFDRVPDGARPDVAQVIVSSLNARAGISAGIMGGLYMERALTGSAFRLPPGADVRGLTQDLPVSVGYFNATGIKASQGRLPTDQELLTGQPTAVVSELVAKTYWPGTPAIGQTLSGREATIEVVGVVPDVRLAARDLPAQGEIYHSLALRGARSVSNSANLFVRAPSTRLAQSAVLETAEAAGYQISIARADSVDDRVSQSIAARRLSAWLLGGFGGSALLIAVVGAFGTASASVAQRRHEIAVRIALGSSAREVVRLLLVRHLRPIVIGLAAGGGLALLSAKAIGSLLYGVTSVPSGWWFAAALGVVLATSVAVLGPVVRASRIDPMVALKVD